MTPEWQDHSCELGRWTEEQSTFWLSHDTRQGPYVATGLLVTALRRILSCWSMVSLPPPGAQILFNMHDSLLSICSNIHVTTPCVTSEIFYNWHQVSSHDLVYFYFSPIHPYSLSPTLSYLINNFYLLSNFKILHLSWSFQAACY